MTPGRKFASTREDVALNEWQICEINKALGEADRGEFATPREVQRTIRTWTRRATQPLSR
jgi:predicted transcriptional regulator